MEAALRGSCNAAFWTAGALFPGVGLTVRASDRCRWASKRKVFSQNSTFSSSSSLLTSGAASPRVFNHPPVSSAGGAERVGGGVAVLHHRDPLRGAVEGGHHVGPLDAGQRGAEQPQGGALTLGPGGQQGAGRSLAAPKQVQLLGLVAQRGAQLPPAAAAAAPLLQEALHLLLPVGGQVDVQPGVLLAVPLRACGQEGREGDQSVLLVDVVGMSRRQQCDVSSLHCRLKTWNIGAKKVDSCSKRLFFVLWIYFIGVVGLKPRVKMYLNSHETERKTI